MERYDFWGFGVGGGEGVGGLQGGEQGGFIDGGEVAARGAFFPPAAGDGSEGFRGLLAEKIPQVGGEHEVEVGDGGIEGGKNFAGGAKGEAVEMRHGGGVGEGKGEVVGAVGWDGHGWLGWKWLRFWRGGRYLRCLSSLEMPRMNDTAKLFKHGRSQAVRLPKAFRMPGTEVRVPMERDVADFRAVFAQIDGMGGGVFLEEGRPAQPAMPDQKADFGE